MQLTPDIIQNKMEFWDACFFLSVLEMDRLVQVGWYYSILLKYIHIMLVGQNSTLSLSPCTESIRERSVNSPNIILF